MRKSIPTRLLSLFFVFLTGCATFYAPPKQNEPASLIQAKSIRKGLFNATHPWIVAINNKAAGIQLSNTIRIHPGHHTLTIGTQFSRGFMTGGPYEAYSDVSAAFKPGMVYNIHSEVQGSKVLTWITDNSGKKVSEISTADYRSIPRNNVIFVPAGR